MPILFQNNFNVNSLSANYQILLEPVKGFEPSTHALQKRCSTTELHRRGITLRRLSFYQLAELFFLFCAKVHQLAFQFSMSLF